MQRELVDCHVADATVRALERAFAYVHALCVDQDVLLALGCKVAPPPATREASLAIGDGHVGIHLLDVVGSHMFAELRVARKRASCTILPIASSRRLYAIDQTRRRDETAARPPYNANTQLGIPSGRK